MQKYKEDGQRADVLHKENIEMEKASAKGSPIGELVVHHLVRYKPANEDAGQEAHNGQEDLACDEVEPVEQRLAEEVQTIDGTQ